jgi:multiple sugar transport system permease protein
VTVGRDASHLVGRRWVASPARRWPWLRSRALKGIGYATPTAIIVGVFFIVPLVLVFWMSVNQWPLLGSPTANFPDNYKAIKDNQLFKDSVVFTLKYTAIVTIVLSSFAMALALMVQQPRRGVGIMRTAYFVPGAVGFAAASLLFYGFYSETGPLNDILHSIGIINEPVAWLGSKDRALFSTIAMVIWRFAGFNMLILLTGLAAIPTDVYEAARVDGARSWQTFRHITLPLLRPTIALMLVLSITGSLLAFDQFFILTRGGPDGSTVSMVMVIYREAFTQFNLGSAAALSVLLLLALVVLNVVQLRIFAQREDR